MCFYILLQFVRYLEILFHIDLFLWDILHTIYISMLNTLLIFSDIFWKCYHSEIDLDIISILLKLTLDRVWRKIVQSVLHGSFCCKIILLGNLMCT